MIKKIGLVVASLCLGFFLTAGLPLLAQSGSAQTSPTQPNPAPTSPRPVRPSQPGAVSPDMRPDMRPGMRPDMNPSMRPGMTSPTSQAQLTEVDKQYMMDANRNAIAALALGQLAMDKAENDQVKRFVQAEMDEQTQVREQLTRLAPTVGVNLPSAPTPKDQEVLTRMVRLTGPQFDRAIMDELGINAHLENAAIYQREAALGQNRDLVGVATRGLPIITQHYNTASALTGYQVAQVPARIDAGSALNSSGSPNSITPR
jgi:putative membrane protein